MIKIRKREYRKHITQKSYVLDFATIKKDLELEPEEFIVKLNNKDEEVLNYLAMLEEKKYFRRHISMNSMIATGEPDSSDYIIEFKHKDS